MKTKLFIILFIIIPLVLGLKLLAIRGKYLGTKASSTNWWEIQSIDTVKYSRDLAREKAKDSSFDEVIDTQVRLIAETGATHFEEGDIFSSCTECENGGPGDPRRSGDVAGHRNFLTEEYKITNDAFRKIGKNVRSNFAP